MKFHTLQSVWSADASALTRHLSEGKGLDQNQIGSITLDPVDLFCCDDWINDRLASLHRMARLGYGRNIQAHIDSYIPAVAYLRCCSSASCAAGALNLRLKEQAAFARRMVLCISDAPQEGTLPDLGFKVRSVMLAFRVTGPRGGKAAQKAPIGDFPLVLADDCYVTQMLFQALPCMKRGNKCGAKDLSLSGYQIGLNVLLGLMLGLYPSAVKFPPFSVRVTVYMRIHQLLTVGGGREFCEAHPMLMTMAFMEYCAHVIPAYMPAEHRVILGEPGMAGFFSALPVMCDVFRQEMLNGMGSECDVQWELLERHCESTVDKHTRACRNRAKIRREDYGVGSRIPLDVVRAFSTLPFVIPYDVHMEDPTQRIMGSELAALDQGGTAEVPECESVLSSVEGEAEEEIGKTWTAHKRQLHEMVASMQCILRVASLPANVVRKQLRSLRVCMGVCERSALDGMTLYVCASCGLGSSGASRSLQTRGQCRLDGSCFSVGGSQMKYVCSHCQAPAVVAVNTLGRVVTLRTQRFYLAPCCCTVQVYVGSGVEFQSEYCIGDSEAAGAQVSAGVVQHSCPHQRRIPPARPQRARCEVCQTTSSGAVAPEVFTTVDHLTGLERSIRLCSRHAPRHETLKHVANWEQLMREVNKRDRPLFAMNAK